MKGARDTYRLYFDGVRDNLIKNYVREGRGARWIPLVALYLVCTTFEVYHDHNQATAHQQKHKIPILDADRTDDCCATWCPIVAVDSYTPVYAVELNLPNAVSFV